MKNTTFGNVWLHRQLMNVLKVMDVRLLYAFSSIFVVPVCLLFNTNHSRTTAYLFFRQRMGYGRVRAAWATYVNHCLFSQVVIDRFAMFAGKHFKVETIGYEYFDRLENAEEGFLQLSSHIGCYEMAGYSMAATKKRLNALVFGGEKATVMEGRQKLFEHTNIRMIPIQDDMTHLFLVNEALANHETVSMPADRMVGAKKTIELDLLGAKAKFGLGPFSVATMCGLEVLAINVMKTSWRGYTIYIAPLHYDHQAPRKEQMRQLAESYVGEFERMVKMYPEQWYNFYDFWK